MEFPVYDGIEHHTDYLEKLEEYLKTKNNDKYNIIFGFIKEWLKDTNINLKSLNNFKNINKNFLPSDEKNTLILEKNSSEILDKLDLQDKSINKENIYDFLNSILNSINYKLSAFKDGNIIRLSIVNNIFF